MNTDPPRTAAAINRQFKAAGDCEGYTERDTSPLANLARDLELHNVRLRAVARQFEQLIDQPVAESGGYHYTMANAPVELVSEARALLAKAGDET